MEFVLGGQTPGIKTKSLRTGTKNFKNQDGEDVDVLRRPYNNEENSAFYESL